MDQHNRFFPCRYCVCTVCAGTKKILKPFRSHLLDTHPSPCNCPCDSCSSGACRPPAVDLFWVQEHLLCSKSWHPFTTRTRGTQTKENLGQETGTHYRFKDFVGQMAEAFIHKQLDKLTSDIHRRTIHGVDEESKRLILHFDFSQDLAHAQANQSMCEFFDCISSSLFIAFAHLWDPVTKQLECEVNFPLRFRPDFA